ncbi:MAG: hypothetical protein PVF27_05420 [Gemmatimonadales bacterium]|jgi:hypothetical protein
MPRSLAVIALAGVLGACSIAYGAQAPAYPLGEEVDIPPGHMPPPGACRIWHPGEPPGQQPPPGDCDELKAAVPPGAWLLYRPNEDERVFRIG